MPGERASDEREQKRRALERDPGNGNGSERWCRRARERDPGGARPAEMPVDDARGEPARHERRRYAAERHSVRRLVCKERTAHGEAK